LSRGLEVLSFIRGAPEAVRVSEIVEQCGLDRATVYRILTELVEHRYVEKQGRFHYKSGEAFHRPVPAADSGLTSHLKQLLLEISSKTRETGFAIVPYGTQSMYVAFSSDDHKLQTLRFNKGHCHPLGVGAAGLAYLGALDTESADQIIHANESSLKAYNRLSVDKLKNMTATTRDRGWSISCYVLDQQSLGVGCAVYDSKHQPVAAISVAAPIYRMNIERQKRIAYSMQDILARYSFRA